MGGGACLWRWEDTWQKLLHSFPTSNINHQACRRDPLFAETSHQFPEKFFSYVCVCSCVGAHVYAGSVHLSCSPLCLQRPQMPHWFPKCRYSYPWGRACPRYESYRLQAAYHACPAFILHVWGSRFHSSHSGGKCSTQRAIFPTQNL